MLSQKSKLKLIIIVLILYTILFITDVIISSFNYRFNTIDILIIIFKLVINAGIPLFYFINNLDFKKNITTLDKILFINYLVNSFFEIIDFKYSIYWTINSFVNIMFCIFLFIVLFKKESKALTISILTGILFFVQFIITIINYIQNFKMILVINITIYILYITYIVTMMTYLMKKYKSELIPNNKKEGKLKWKRFIYY